MISTTTQPQNRTNFGAKFDKPLKNIILNAAKKGEIDLFQAENLCKIESDTATSHLKISIKADKNDILLKLKDPNFNPEKSSLFYHESFILGETKKNKFARQKLVDILKDLTITHIKKVANENIDPNIQKETTNGALELLTKCFGMKTAPAEQHAFAAIIKKPKPQLNLQS